MSLGKLNSTVKAYKCSQKAHVKLFHVTQVAVKALVYTNMKKIFLFQSSNFFYQTLHLLVGFIRDPAGHL